MKDKPLHLLVVTDDPDDVQLLEEAFLELEEIRFSRAWLRPAERTYAVSPEEALETAVRERFDAVVLDLNLGGGLEAPALFHRLREYAPQLPVVVLAGPQQDALAMTLVRQGAQDFLPKSEIDCLPLARALSCAVVRQQMEEAKRRLALVDDLTGMWNERGFGLIGQTQLGMAARCGLPVLVASAEAPARSQGDLELIEAADLFRAALPESAIAARLGGTRFAAVVVDAGGDVAVEAQSKLAGWREIRWTTLQPQEEFEPAMQGALHSLCENVGVAARAGRHI
jgi:two-component system cell cycle response regulator